MNDIFKTIIVAADQVAQARELAETVSGGAGMFKVGLSGDGKNPASHYISSGIISYELAALFPQSTDENPFEAMERLGLVLISNPAEE